MFIAASAAQFELVTHKFPNKTTLNVYLYSFQIIDDVELCTTRQQINYHDTTSHNFRHVPKYCKTFELP